MLSPNMNIFLTRSLNINDFISQSTAILGVKGSGKSVTGSVLAEELLKKKVGLTIVDIEGEYYGLKEQFELLMVGGEHQDIDISLEYASELARVVLENNTPVILDLSNFSDEERDEFLLDYLQSLWESAQRLRIPHIIIFEEAHEFIPQGVNSPLKELIIRISLRGRKRGLSAVLLSQRSANVDKKALTQTEILFLHRVVHPADYSVYADLLAMTNKDVKEQVPALENGEVFFKYNGRVDRLQVRNQETFHAGFTPSFDQEITTPPLKSLTKDILEAFKQITSRKKKESDELSKLQNQLKKYEASNVELQKEVNNLKQQLDIISRIKVEINLPPEQIIRKAVINELWTQGLIEQKKDTGPSSTPVSKDYSPNSSSSSIYYAYKDFPEPITKLFEHIKSQLIKNTSQLEFRILAFLENRFPNAYLTDQLSAWLGITLGTLQHNKPKYLLDIGIITRERSGSQFSYKSNLKTFMGMKFESFGEEIGESAVQILVNEFRIWLFSESEQLNGKK